MTSVESLRCFLEAARLLNFRAAARSVALSPAALGQRIRLLEDEMGVVLFHRTTRTVVLTEAGLGLVPYAKRALQSVADCKLASRGELAAAEVELVLGTRHELGISWLVPLRSLLLKQHPGLSLHYYFGSGQDLVHSVRSLAIDCAVTSTRITDPKLDSLRLHEEAYVFVGQPKMLSKRPFKRAEHAKTHTLIDTTEELPLFRYWRDSPGGVDSLDFGEVLRMGTIAAIREMVLRGYGVAVLPEYFVDKDLRARRLAKVMPRSALLSDHFRLVFRADDPRRSYFASLADTMRSVALR